MKYFCWRCSQEHDTDYEAPTNSGVGPICPPCAAKREEALSRFKAEYMEEHIKQTEKRHAH